MNHFLSSERETALILKNFRKAASVLRALGNERRLQILCFLQVKERHVHELERLVGISQSALSQHLARLRRDELVIARREAQSKVYSLANSEVHDILSTLSQLYADKEHEPPRLAGRRMSY